MMKILQIKKETKLKQCTFHSASELDGKNLIYFMKNYFKSNGILKLTFPNEIHYNNTVESLDNILNNSKNGQKTSSSAVICLRSGIYDRNVYL